MAPTDRPASVTRIIAELPLPAIVVSRSSMGRAPAMRPTGTATFDGADRGPKRRRHHLQGLGGHQSGRDLRRAPVLEHPHRCRRVGGGGRAGEEGVDGHPPRTGEHRAHHVRAAAPLEHPVDRGHLALAAGHADQPPTDHAHQEGVDRGSRRAGRRHLPAPEGHDHGTEGHAGGRGELAGPPPVTGHGPRGRVQDATTVEGGGRDEVEHAEQEVDDRQPADRLVYQPSRTEWVQGLLGGQQQATGGQADERAGRQRAAPPSGPWPPRPRCGSRPRSTRA